MTSFFCFHFLRILKTLGLFFGFVSPFGVDFCSPKSTRRVRSVWRSWRRRDGCHLSVSQRCFAEPKKKRHVGQAKGAELSCFCFGIEGAGPGPWSFRCLCVKNWRMNEKLKVIVGTSIFEGWVMFITCYICYCHLYLIYIHFPLSI